PVYLYCFDSEKYIDERGFYIDFWRDLPVLYSKNARGICNFISSGSAADSEKVSAFKEAYVNKKYDSITSVWAEIINELMQGKYDKRYNYTHGGE
ncbi:MAG: CDP-glycerol glycerophosphotransferase family protein, partial [Eubacterium sp.]|nr:CDP-glycerol glycerophosphotransferase family protein [Eubacterium sp.]